MTASRPLDRFPIIRARNMEDAHDALSRVYSNNMTVESLERHHAIDISINNCQLSQIGLNYTGYGADVRVHFTGSKFTTLSFPLRGNGTVSINGREMMLGASCGLTMPAETSFAVKLSANYEHVVLRLDPKALERKLEAIIGRTADQPLQFDPLFYFSSSAARLLRRQVLLLTDQLSSAEMKLPKLVLAEFEELLIATFLLANRHNYSHLLERATPDAAPWQVRRAEEYIEANWRQPITLEHLAAVTGVSAFGLFRSFKNSRGYSPTEFANQVRLRHARESLRYPDGATTVETVAFSCGFADLRRFVDDYLETFGEHPAQTLDRNRGSRA